MTETTSAVNVTPNRALVDSNVLIAHVNTNDSLHKAALALVEMAAQAKIEVVYFDCVVAESLSVIARRLEEKKRMNEFGALADRLFEIAPEESLEWLFPSGKIVNITLWPLCSTLSYRRCWSPRPRPPPRSVSTPGPMRG